MSEEENMDSDENDYSDEGLESHESMDSDEIFGSDSSMDFDEDSNGGLASDGSEDSEVEEHTRDFSNWTRAIQAYVKETNVSCLDLQVPSINGILIYIPFETVESILNFLPDSAVTELILDEIRFPKETGNFCELLKKTKVEKLSTKNCFQSCSELLDVAKILNDTKITDWDAYTSKLNQPDVVKGKELVSCLLRSRLTKLTLNLADHVDEQGALSFVEGLPNTSLTSLRIVFNQKQRELTNKILLALFSQLPHCKIRDLNLSSAGIGDDLIKELGRNLAASNIETLNLESNKIKDSGLDVLAQSLINSNVTVLNVRDNDISGKNNFGDCLKNTKIKVLDLGYNHIRHSKMFEFSNFFKDSMVEELDISRGNNLSDKCLAEVISSLKFSKVLKLNLTRCINFGILSLSELVSVLKCTGLEDINLSQIDLPSETFDILNKCIKESKLKRIQLKGPESKQAAVSCLRFIESTKNSSILSIDIQESCFGKSHVELFARALMNSTFTHLNLHCSNLSDAFTCLAENLKHTSITHLNLSECSLEDKHVEILAEHLMEAKIVELNLSKNMIRYDGVIALECCPATSVIRLFLDECAIRNESLEDLAESFTDSFITTTSIQGNRADRTFLIENVMVENKKRSLKLVTFFKLIYPENGNGNFCFHQCIPDRDVSDFLEECLQFHKSVVEQPAVVSVLLEEKSLSFSRRELVDILFDKFPRQFVEFISKWIEADISQHVKLLERADELGLVKLVENLLLLRPLYTIDVTEGIMHPYVYKLLHKHKQLICNVEVEPTGISKIIDYFTEHADIDGAADVINLLSVPKTA